MTAAALMATASCRQPSPTQPIALPNIILITIDTLRADHLGCYGYFRDTSPTIDALAAESILFERCIVPMATTLPTHTSILTGTYPLEHGILANLKHGEEGEFLFVPSPQLKSFAQYAGEIGYQTAAFVSATPLKKNTGIEAGFDTFDQPAGSQRLAAQTTKRVVDWLQTRSAAPFFLWVHYFDPHNPYKPPPPYNKLFTTDDQLEAYLQEARFSDRSRRPAGESVVTRPAINGYDGEIRYTDDQLAVLFDAFKAQDIWDDAVILLVGDHGEGLGQHHEPGHGLVWDEQLHAPLLIRVPGRVAKRVSGPMSAVDILPTLLGMIDLPVAESFLGQMSGVDALAERNAHRYLLSRLSDRQLDFDRKMVYTLTGAEWKYFQSVGGGERLFNLRDDPYELHDVAADHPNVVVELRRQMDEQRSAQERRGLVLESGDITPVDPTTRQHLIDLGYAGDGEDEEPDETASPDANESAPR